MITKQTAIDARLAALLPQVDLLQESYLANFGKYFQGLSTHATLPDGETATPVDSSVHPGDQKHDYADFWRRVHWSEPDENGEREELYEFPASALDDVSALSVRVRFNVCQGDTWTWSMVIDYEDASGHWEKVMVREGVKEHWHLVEAEEAGV